MQQILFNKKRHDPFTNATSAINKKLLVLLTCKKWSALMENCDKIYLQDVTSLCTKSNEYCSKSYKAMTFTSSFSRDFILSHVFGINSK